MTAYNSFVQCLNTLVLGTDSSSQLVLHLFIAPVRQYRSTPYRHSPRHVCLLTALVAQYLIRTTPHGIFLICLVRWYVSTVVLGTDTHHSMFICLVRQNRSTWYGQLITARSLFVWCVSTFISFIYLSWSSRSNGQTSFNDLARQKA